MVQQDTFPNNIWEFLDYLDLIALKAEPCSKQQKKIAILVSSP